MMRLALILLLAVPLFAADVEVGVRHLALFPHGDSGQLDIPMGRGFAATADVFWNERISTQFAASFANPEAILRPENAEPVDLGTLGLDIYSASVRYHFPLSSRAKSRDLDGGAAGRSSHLAHPAPSTDARDDKLGSRLSTYVGAGAAFVVIGNLDDQFGDELETSFGNELTFLGEAGIRYRIFPRVFIDLGAAYMPLGAESDALDINVDPLIVTAGAAWRF